MKLSLPYTLLFTYFKENLCILSLLCRKNVQINGIIKVKLTFFRYFFKKRHWNVNSSLQNFVTFKTDNQNSLSF
jgi:hypothetical protein